MNKIKTTLLIVGIIMVLGSIALWIYTYISMQSNVWIFPVSPRLRGEQVLTMDIEVQILDLGDGWKTSGGRSPHFGEPYATYSPRLMELIAENRSNVYTEDFFHPDNWRINVGNWQVHPVDSVFNYLEKYHLSNVQHDPSANLWIYRYSRNRDYDFTFSLEATTIFVAVDGNTEEILRIWIH